MAVNRLNVGATNQLLAKASSGQSTNILELQNTAGTTVAGIDASGNPVGTLIHPPTFKNLIINGAMQVAQRGTSTASITSDTYGATDRWRFLPSSQGTWTMSQENDAPTGSGFRKSTKVLCTTADASPAAGDYVRLDQRIEGQNLQQIAKGTSSAKQLTLSFWVKANVTGTYIARFYENDNNRNVSKSYTINSSGVWEYKTITFPADTTGPLDNDSDASLILIFMLGAGSDFTSGTLATTWQSFTAANVAPGQTNLAAATNNYWQITGVQLEVGSVATDYEFKPIDVELTQCQRYYWRKTGADYYLASGGIASSGTLCYVPTEHPTTMRAAPSSIDFSNLNLQIITNNFNVTNVTINAGSPNMSLLLCTVASGLTATTQSYMLRTQGNASYYLGLSAEL